MADATTTQANDVVNEVEEPLIIVNTSRNRRDKCGNCYQTSLKPMKICSVCKQTKCVSFKVRLCPMINLMQVLFGRVPKTRLEGKELDPSGN